jgi:GT2 family glycosyltransferase
VLSTTTIAGHRNALAELETAAASHVEAKEFNVALRLIHAKAGELWLRTQASGWISGSDRLDRFCLSIGREVRGLTDRRPPAALADRRRHVYVVSELYREGGHTRLLEDLIAAQPHDDHQIIWTYCESAAVIPKMAEVLRVEKAIPVHVLPGEPVERLRWAFAILTELCPDVLVHLGHPNDPITIALMQPDIARQRLIIHHADGSFALGRSLEGTVHIALGRHFQDFARREWALETVLLPLTCGEPVVPKAAGWARDRPFLTVTSGSSGKFDLNAELSYLDILTERFAARDGAHVHIGSLSAEQMLRIEQHLDKLCCRERFVYTEHVPHLASTLSELAPSVYIDSYPAGGGKAIVEAMAAGLPICAANHDPNLDSSSFCYPECFWWTHPAQVGTILAGLDPKTVEHHAALSRNYFERNHSPKIFFERLLQALGCQWQGAESPAIETPDCHAAFQDAPMIDILSEQIAPALYRGILEREPDPAGLAHAIEELRSGQPLEELIRTFIRSPEFRTRVLQLLPDISSEQIAPALYRGILEREPDPAGLAHAIEELRSGQPLEELIRTFIRSPEFRTRVLQLLIPSVQLPDLTEVESAYRLVLGERPDDADLHMQLGHIRKLLGRHAAALDSYGHAARLAPSSITPQRALVQMGERRNQEYLFEGQLRLGGVEALMAMTQQVLELRATLSRLIEALPDVQAQMAFPIGCYDRFRAMYDVPITPSVQMPRTYAILLLADREPVETFLSQLSAITSQTYESWTLYLIGFDPARQRIAKRAAASDARIRWVETAQQESAAQAEQRIAVSINADWIVLLSERALLHPRAIEWFASAAGRGKATAFVADEETCMRELAGVRRLSPELRQVVDYDTLLEMNTFGETVALERAAFVAVADRLTTSSVSAARSALLLALARDGCIGHIPCPLICRDGETTVDPVRVATAHEEAVRTHVAEGALVGRIDIGPRIGLLPRLPILWRSQDPQASITVIIPTRDNGPDVGRFVDSLRRKAGFTDGLRIVIVDNGSKEADTLSVLEDIAANSWARVLELDQPFNWSRLNNYAVEAVDDSLLVFANDDMVMLSDRWDERLRGLLERPEIGAVGARLLYEDDTVQHAGVLFGWNGSTIHDGIYESSLEPGPASRWQVTRAVSAVTGAFLATRRDSFLAHRGFDEVGLPVTYSDVDYALKLRASGLKILWTPEITLYHYESKTRGLDHLDLEKRARSAAERTVMEARWGPAMLADPSVSPVWHMATLPFRLLSAPSQSRLWAHIERCAAGNPWLPEAKNSVEE